MAHRETDLDRILAERRSHTTSVRDLRGTSDAARTDGTGGRAFGSGRAWLAAALVNLAIVLAVAFGAVAGPPLLECRRRAEIGFFAGDSFQGCFKKETALRLARLESQLRMMVRGSGR